MIYDSRLLDFKHTGLLQGRSQDFWQGERYQERSNRWRDFESEAARSAADQATAVVKGGGQPPLRVWGQGLWVGVDFLC